MPPPGEDKNDSGRVVVVGGSTRSPGAVRLAGESALRAGAGKVALATVEEVLAGLAPLVPEAALVPLATGADGSIDVDEAPRIIEHAGDADVLLAGSGLVDPDHAVDLLDRVLPRTGATVVLDALGSAFLARRPDGLHHLDGRVVLTVNPRELAHVAGADRDEVAEDPVGTAARVASSSRVVVLCGGTVKHVVAPDGEAWVVEGGGPGLATSGSGDVQAGIVAGVLARGAAPLVAALWAGHLHARCGERLAASVGPVGYLARELPAQVPAVLAELG
nr:NAD(P)H-hydrate dehydratase [Nocardioides thalensis]